MPDDEPVEVVDEAGEVVGLTSRQYAIRRPAPAGSGTYADAAVSAVYRIYAVTHDGPFTPADGDVAELVLVPLAGPEVWLAGRDLCDDTRALVLRHVRSLARGHSPRPRNRARG